MVTLSGMHGENDSEAKLMLDERRQWEARGGEEGGEGRERHVCFDFDTRDMIKYLYAC
jgi:hypothetical protein